MMLALKVVWQSNFGIRAIPLKSKTLCLGRGFKSGMKHLGQYRRRLWVRTRRILNHPLTSQRGGLP